MAMPTGSLENNPNKAGFIRKCLSFKQKFFYPGFQTDDGKRVYFLKSEGITREEGFRPLPGRQNKHHGAKPGSYKHKQRIVKKSRRMNRGR